MKFVLVLFHVVMYSMSMKKVPYAFNGKHVFLNGPQVSSNSQFDGYGHITSVSFEKNKAIVSETQIKPSHQSISFPLSDFMERNYIALLSKMPFVFINTDYVQSRTCNTAICKYGNTFFATEDSSSPVGLQFDKTHHLHTNRVNHHGITKMAAHMADEYTCFSYSMYDRYPLKINNTEHVPWEPCYENRPFLIHDCKRVDEFYIFPLMSSSIGKFSEYLQKQLSFPLNSESRKCGWLIYDSKQKYCMEIYGNEYADLFHIAHVKRITSNKFKIYAAHVYQFYDWLIDNKNIDLKLKEITINIRKRKIVKEFNTQLKMDFIHEKQGKLYGSALEKHPSLLIYDMKKKQSFKKKLHGEIVREIIPFEKYFVYFSHENSKNKTFLYIVDNIHYNVVNKIEVPHRLPGFHTSLF